MPDPGVFITGCQEWHLNQNSCKMSVKITLKINRSLISVKKVKKKREPLAVPF